MSRKIEAELTDEEHDMFCMMLGAATGYVIEHFGISRKKQCLTIVNKLLANDPDFFPYDENSNALFSRKTPQ